MFYLLCMFQALDIRHVEDSNNNLKETVENRKDYIGV